VVRPSGRRPWSRWLGNGRRARGAAERPRPGLGTLLGRELLDRYTADGRSIRAVSGFDATFSAPQSLSGANAAKRYGLSRTV